MPSHGSYRLSDLPDAYQVEVGCDRCGREGRYRVRTLVDRFGADCPLPDLQHQLAADCPRLQAAHASDPCGVHYRNRWPWG